MTGEKSKDDLRVVGGKAWKLSEDIIVLKKQALSTDPRVERVTDSWQLAQPPQCPSICELAYEIKLALMIMSDIVIDMRDALQAANQGQCCPPLDMAAANNGEELPKLKGGRCSDLITDQEDFADLDVCRGLEVLRDWLLNISETLC